MDRKINSLIFLLLILLVVSAVAQETDGFLEIDGLVVDETLTKVGRDFYDLFFSNWQAPAGASDYTIFISEKPLPMMGTQVSVHINDMLVFQQFARPRYDELEETAQTAVEYATQYLLNYENIKRQLEGEDLSGTGIF